jgi:hypothetical protein
MPEEEKNCWKILKLISKLAGGSRVEYEIEHKDGLPHKLKNVRIEEISLDKDI